MAPAVMATSTNESLFACTKITNNNERLACFDNIAKTVSPTAVVPATKNVLSSTPKPAMQAANSPAQSTPAVIPQENTAVNRIQTTQAKADMFGQEHIQTSKGLPELTLTIKSLKKNPYGKLKFTFENGQIWQQKDSATLKLKAGDTVIIKRGALSSFYLKKLDANRTVKVKRVK